MLPCAVGRLDLSVPESLLIALSVVLSHACLPCWSVNEDYIYLLGNLSFPSIMAASVNKVLCYLQISFTNLNYLSLL